MRAPRRARGRDSITNHEIRIGKESAHSIASVMIWRRTEEEHFNTHALYTFELKPVDNKWLISAIKQEVLWTEGDSSIHSGSKVAIDERTKIG